MSGETMTIAEAKAAAKVPGPRGAIGKGTPSRRVKRAHQRSRSRDPLKAWVKEHPSPDVEVWLSNKRGPVRG